jgi:DNA-binding CsgD family transcriptional regulator
VTPSLSQARLAAVRRWFDAYDARDVDVLVGLVHPEVRLVPRSPLLSKLQAVTFHGRDGLRTLIEWSYKTHPGIRVESVSHQGIRRGVLSEPVFLLDEGEKPPIRSRPSTLFRFDGVRIRLVQSFGSDKHAVAANASAAVLTPREQEIFQLLAHGLTGPQIADELFLSSATVRTHVQNGMQRLDATTRVHAVSIALGRGEIDPPGRAIRE